MKVVHAQQLHHQQQPSFLDRLEITDRLVSQDQKVTKEHTEIRAHRESQETQGELMQFDELKILIKFDFSPPGPPPDMSHYVQQYNEQNAGGNKGPNSFPEPFQFLQAAVGPIGQRGPPG